MTRVLAAAERSTKNVADATKKGFTFFKMGHTIETEKKKR